MSRATYRELQQLHSAITGRVGKLNSKYKEKKGYSYLLDSLFTEEANLRDVKDFIDTYNHESIFYAIQYDCAFNALDERAFFLKEMHLPEGSRKPWAALLWDTINVVF